MTNGINEFPLPLSGTPISRRTALKVAVAGAATALAAPKTIAATSDKILIGVLILLLAGGGVAACMTWGKEKGVEVRLETVSKRNLVATVTASGRIVPKRKVDISADITGRITNIPVKEGDVVRKGDLLIRIDPSQYEATVARGQAALSSAEAQAVQAAQAE